MYSPRFPLSPDGQEIQIAELNGESNEFKKLKKAQVKDLKIALEVYSEELIYDCVTKKSSPAIRWDNYCS